MSLNPVPYLRPVVEETGFGDSGFADTQFFDHAAYGDVLASDTVIRAYLEPLKRHMREHKATEIWINKPCELILRVESGSVVVHEPLLTFSALEAFAQSIAVYSPQQQTVGVSSPLLSATLPDGERIQIALPPIVEPGLISMSIRIPGSSILPLDKYEKDGSFSRYAWPQPIDFEASLAAILPDDRALARLLHEGRLQDFLIAAVQGCKNIGVIGDTGSGKTTLMKSMCQHIPAHERLITIEDVRELELPNHFNRVHMLYSKNAQGVAKVTPAELISSLMRMDPSRALLAELRGSEAWDFLKLLTSGHRGSITSWHAESCALGFERFVFMAKENSEAATLLREEIKHLVTLTIDVVIHVTRKVVFDNEGNATGYERFVDEVYFDPWAKMKAQFGDKSVPHASSQAS